MLALALLWLQLASKVELTVAGDGCDVAEILHNTTYSEFSSETEKPFKLYSMYFRRCDLAPEFLVYVTTSFFVASHFVGRIRNGHQDTHLYWNCVLER